MVPQPKTRAAVSLPSEAHDVSFDFRHAARAVLRRLVSGYGCAGTFTFNAWREGVKGSPGVACTGFSDVEPSLLHARAVLPPSLGGGPGVVGEAPVELTSRGSHGSVTWVAAEHVVIEDPDATPAPQRFDPSRALPALVAASVTASRSSAPAKRKSVFAPLPPPGAPLPPAPPSFEEYAPAPDLFDNLLDMFSDTVDTKDDPTFLGNAAGACLFASAAAEAQAKADEAALGSANESSGVGSTSTMAGDIRMLDTMAWLLIDDDVLDDFQRSLEAEYAAESLLFWRATLQFDALVQAAVDAQAQLAQQPGSGSGDTRARSGQQPASSVEAEAEASRAADAVDQKAHAIFEEFIKPGSDKQVNVPAKMVSAVRLALGIEDPKERAAVAKRAKAAEAAGKPAEAPPAPPAPPSGVALANVWAACVREVTVMLLKDKVPSYASSVGAPRRMGLVGMVEGAHRGCVTWAHEEGRLLAGDKGALPPAAGGSGTLEDNRPRRQTAAAVAVANESALRKLSKGIITQGEYEEICRMNTRLEEARKGSVDAASIPSNFSEDVGASLSLLTAAWSPFTAGAPALPLAAPPMALLASLGRFPAPPPPPRPTAPAQRPGAPPPIPRAPLGLSGPPLPPPPPSTAATPPRRSPPASGRAPASIANGGLWDLRCGPCGVSGDSTLDAGLATIDALPTAALARVGVIFAAPRQASQAEVLGNAWGSPEFESFVKALAHPEVVAEEAPPGATTGATTPGGPTAGASVGAVAFNGFRGRVTRSDLSAAPGAATVPCLTVQGVELALHVSTHLRTDGEQQIVKTRHIGNDWVSVVWCEGDRDFLPSALTSQLASAVVVVYPHRRTTGTKPAPGAVSLFRVQLLVKEPLGPLASCVGPLSDGAVVGGAALPALVRQTCLNMHAALRKEMSDELENTQRRASALARADASAHDSAAAPVQ